MTWCQISVLVMSSNIMHAYVKQNDMVFLTWLALYTTSLLYHYTKFNYPVSERFKTPFFYTDVSTVYLTYMIGLYELYRSHAYLSCITHLSTPFLYFGSSYKHRFMWSEDEKLREFWHSMFHYFVILQSHIYLYLY